jgi:hypothetical protein
VLNTSNSLALICEFPTTAVCLLFLEANIVLVEITLSLFALTIFVVEDKVFLFVKFGVIIGDEVDRDIFVLIVEDDISVTRDKTFVEVDSVVVENGR